MKTSDIIAKALGEEIVNVWPDLGNARALGEHLADMGYPVSHSIACQVTKILGLQRLYNGRRQNEPSARALIIIERREVAGETYKDIGRDVGISAERVRQILQRWRPDLTGREDTSVTMTCPNCETQHQRTPSRVKDDAPHFCDRACFVEYCARTPTVLERRVLDTALAMRPEATWREVGTALGLNGSNYMNLPSRVKKIAAKTGKDVSRCFTRAQ